MSNEKEYLPKIAMSIVAHPDDQDFTVAGTLAKWGYMAQLEKLDTSRVSPTFHAVAQKNVFREDAVQPSLNIDLTLSNSPDPDRGFFRVPKIIE